MTTVLHIQKAKGIAGSENHLLALLPELKRRGFDIQFLGLVEARSRTDEFCIQMDSRGIRTVAVPVRCDIDPICLWQVYSVIKKVEPDLVHTHLMHGDLYGTVAAKLAGVPHVISTKHNDDDFRRKWLFRKLSSRLNRHCDCIITISNSLRKFISQVENVAEDRIKTIHYGLSVNGGPERPVSRADFLIPETATVLGCVGRLAEQKGHRYLIEALQILASSNSPLYLILVGEGPLRRRLERQVNSLGLDGRVIFAGWRPDVRIILSSIVDILVHPSLWEGFGLVLLEAMAAGKPVVATRSSAIPEIVEDGRTGILVSPRDSVALAEAVLHLIQDRELRQKMGEQGRRRLLEQFTVEEMVEKTEALYTAIVAD